jgi:hypothetical protein
VEELICCCNFFLVWWILHRFEFLFEFSPRAICLKKLSGGCHISSDSIRYTHKKINIHHDLYFVLQIAQEYSECPSGKKGGDLGWFPRGKMAGPFQEVAFSTPVGATSAPFKSTYVFFLDY